MAASLARRTGTVGALVAAAGVTMVAGAWPALAAAPLDPRPAEVQGVGGGLDTAPGQAADEPAAVEASPLAEQPVEQPVEQPLEPVAAEPLAEPVVEEPAVRSPRGRSSLAPGRERIAAQAPVDEPATGPVAEPVAEPVDQPAAAGPIVGPPTGVGKGRDKKAPAPDSGRPAPRTEPAAPAAPAAEAPAAAQGKGSGVLAERRSRAAAAAPPAAPAAAPPAGPAVGPVARPRSSAPVVGPVVPAAPPDRVADPAPVMGPQVPRAARPSALATAGSRSGRAQVAAADAVPLRPSGAEPIALPDVVAQPRPLPVDLGTALPTVAAQTVGAVARTPEWPLGIVGVVLVFLLVQNRIDRRDPKLSHAHVEDEAPLDFEPLSGRPQLRLVTAA